MPSSDRRASTPVVPASGTARSVSLRPGPEERWAWPTASSGRPPTTPIGSSTPARSTPRHGRCRRARRGGAGDRRRPARPGRPGHRPGADRAPHRRTDRNDHHRPLRPRARTRRTGPRPGACRTRGRPVALPPPAPQRARPRPDRPPRAPELQQRDRSAATRRGRGAGSGAAPRGLGQWRSSAACASTMPGPKASQIEMGLPPRWQ